MNQIKKYQQLANKIMLLSTACLLQGCAVMLWPHTTPRSDEVSGRVLDAKTLLPVQGAKLSFLQKPFDPIYTDKNGNFHAKATRTFHWVSGADGSGQKMSDRNISHPDYVTRTGNWRGDVGNVVLQPKN